MYKFAKRFLDLLISFIAFVIAFPFMLPIVIVLLLTGEHYVFYLQERVGYKNRRFNIIKFATMLRNSPNMGTGAITVRNDPRLLPLGKFLRMTKLNEVPQIINVLKGDMSLVGPRPLMEKSFLNYSPEVQARIYDSVPGITGIGSVVFRDEELMVSQSNLPPEEFYRTIIIPYKGELEMWYNNNKSIRTDFLIIFLTFWVVIFPKSKLQYKVFKNLPKKA
jgi:lipopolysaccharide/colanic/teichoic acid biosynthesis glycosyltransferase